MKKILILDSRRFGRRKSTNKLRQMTHA